METKKAIQRIALGIILVFSLNAIVSDSHISPLSTRVIFHEDNEYETIKEQNNSPDEFYGLEAWTESSDSGDPENIITDSVDSKFIISPKFTLVPPGNKEVTLHITKLPGAKLPKDRESLFYITLQEIPSGTSINKLTGETQGMANALQFAIRTKIKLIYRPKKIKAISHENLEEKLSATIYNDSMMVVNSSEYVINAVNIYSQLPAKELIFNDIITHKYKGIIAAPVILEPFSNTVIPLKKKLHIDDGKKQLAYINDEGRVDLLSVPVKKESQSFIFKGKSL